MARAFAADAPDGAADVPETRFGVWFQGTQIWQSYVLLETLAELERVLARPGARFARALDAGCGQGFALPLLRERFGAERVVGVDSDPALVARAVRGGAAGGEVRVSDVTRLDLPDGAFDLALCHQTLHHVTDQRRALAEMRRVLAPGGVLLLAESCRPFIESWWVRLFFRHAMEVQRSAEEYVELVRSAGFEIAPQAISTPDPWWSLPDLGLWRRLRGRAAPRPHTLVCLAAVRPA